MSPSPHSIVPLDQEVKISYSQLARYRMGTIEPRPFDLRDLSNQRRSYAALVAWVWACLAPEHHTDYPTPESLAPQITAERAGAAMKALGEAVQAAHPSPKNADGSTPKPLPASS